MRRKFPKPRESAAVSKQAFSREPGIVMASESPDLQAIAANAQAAHCGKGAPAVVNRDAVGHSRWQTKMAILADLPEAELAEFDIARLNMLCAAGLPGTEGIDPDACIRTLDGWTEYIRRNVEGWWPDFLRSPREGEDSPGKFRMMAIATLLQRQLGVHYNLRFNEGEYDGRDSRNLLLHGPLAGHGGTCVTLPVLYIAIARRLGYPVFLTRTKDHYLARWDEPGVERFNIECTCRGFASHSDEHYCTWKTPITDSEVRRGAFLRNLTRREEFACFLSERGNCLLDHLQIGEALEAYHHAHRIAPRDECIRANWIVASMMGRALEGAKRAADRRGTHRIVVDEIPYPEPRDADEAKAIPHARETFARILRLHGKRHPVTPSR